jgi:hypothetical protein
MARTTIHGWRVLAMVAVLAVSNCDPYPNQNTAKPEILAVFASDGSTSVEGQLESGTWTLTLPSTLVPGDPTAQPPVPDTVVALQPVIFVRTNKLLDGATVQTAGETANSDGDCTPRDNWLNVSPAAASGNVWYSCYDPSSATPSEGSAIVLFQSTSPISRSGNGWFAPTVVLPGLQNAPQTYTLDGSVKDQDGNDLPISVSVTVNPP